MRRGSTNFMILFLSISSIVGNALTILSGLIVARWLLPSDLGLFNSFTIITSYIILVQLGIPSGLSRELPLYMGKEDEITAKAYASVSHFWQLSLGVITWLVTAAIAIYLLTQGDYLNAAGAFVVGVTAFQALYVTKYLKVLYRSNKDFNRLSQLKLINAVVAFASIAFVWKYGFFGLCLRAIVMAVFDFYFAWKWKPLSVKPSWNLLYYKNLFRVGLPMYSVANVYSLWPVVQKTAILSLGGTHALGLFSLAIIVETSMNTVSTSISSVIYPSMTTAWGKGTSIIGILGLLKKPLIIAVPLFLLMVFAGWFILPPLVKALLPNYTEGIYAAQWMLCVGFLEVFNVLSNVYNVVRKQKDRLFSYLAGIAAWAVSGFLLLHWKGYSLDIFPKAMIFGFLVILIMNMIHIHGYIRNRIQVVV